MSLDQEFIGFSYITLHVQCSQLECSGLACWSLEYTKNYLCNTPTHGHMSIEHALNGIWIF